MPSKKSDNSDNPRPAGQPPEESSQQASPRDPASRRRVPPPPIKSLPEGPLASASSKRSADAPTPSVAQTPPGESINPPAPTPASSQINHPASPGAASPAARKPSQANPPAAAPPASQAVSAPRPSISRSNPFDLDDSPPEQPLSPVGPEAYAPGLPETDAPSLRASRRPPWLVFLMANLPIPLVLFAFFYIGKYLENPDHIGRYYTTIIQLIGLNIILAVSLQLINGISGQFSLGHAGFMAIGAYIAGYASLNFGDLPLNDDEGNILRLQNAPAVLAFFLNALLLVGLISAALVLIFWLARLTRHLHAKLPSLATLAVVIWIVADLSAGYRLAHISWFTPWSLLLQQVENLYSYLQSVALPLAQSLALGMSPDTRQPLTLFVTILGGSIFAALAGLLIGLPTLRLRGDYLAIATLGFAEIIRVIIINTPAVGGATGLTNIPTYSTDADPYLNLGAHYLTPWIYATVLFTTLVVWRINNSAKGRCFHAVKEDEIAASSIGINTTRHKVTAFVIGAFFAGAAGALYAHKDGYLHTNRFEILRSIEVVVMVTLGGLGSISGAILAAIVLTLLPELLRMPAPGFVPAQYHDTIQNIMTRIAEARIAIYALLLIVMMILRPQGLLGQRELWPRFRRKRPRVDVDLSTQLVPASGMPPSSASAVEHGPDSSIDPAVLDPALDDPEDHPDDAPPAPGGPR